MIVKLANENFKSDYGANLLRSRGIDDVDLFCNTNESCLQDWRDLDNIVDGVRLIQDLSPTAYVGMIVDCDCDGFTSSAILYQYVHRLLPLVKFKFYIHDGKRHGLEEHWEEIAQENFDLLIIPDAGSNDSQYAKEINCPILILDHHLVENNDFVPNMTIVNNQLSPNYRNKNLSGAGVVFQFCRALDFYFNKKWAYDYIDLAALGIDGDMMSGLEIENQYFWQHGFKEIKNYFILTLARKQAYSLSGKTDITDEDLPRYLNPISVAFYIVPLINAMTRSGTHEEKERMFLAFIDGHSPVSCNKKGAKGTLEEVAVESARECTNAKSRQGRERDKAIARIEERIFKYDLLENQILFIRLDETDKFPPELNGLIATEFSKKYKRPTVVARLNDEGYIRGSIRGISETGLDSFKNYLDSTGLCEYVQGHDNAAGISIAADNLKKLHEMANRDLVDYHFGEDTYNINFERQAMNDDITNIIFDLDKYKNVWSTGNPEPFIYVKDLHFTYGDVQVMKKDTVKIIKNGIAYMKFNGKGLVSELAPGKNYRMELVGRLKVNEYYSSRTPQIMIESYEIFEDKEIDF